MNKFNVLCIIILLCCVPNCQANDKYYSQPAFGQDRYLNEHIFHNKVGGTFVDIGANDGVTFSNSYFFEKNLGWNGIAIEPLPGAFEKLKKARSCICINAAVAAKSGTAAFYKAQGSVEMLSGLVSSYDPRHLDRMKNEIRSNGGSFETVNIQTVCLNDVLKKHNINSVDYLSIDTEGSELEILQSINYEQYKINAISVENNYNDNRIKPFLESKGFVLIAQLGEDEIYIKTELSITKDHVWYQRVFTTIGCRDCDYIPKVAGAGQIFSLEDGTKYQLMHNGIKIYADCYCGSWMTDIIKYLQGHHEPQEEKVFYEVLKEIPAGAVMMELGSFWAYYSMWFSKTISAAKTFMIESELGSLKVGERNFALNNMNGTFINAFIGDSSKQLENGAMQRSVDDIIDQYQLPFVNIVHSDIQGAEYSMLQGCKRALMKKKIGYFFISTHSDYVHKACLQFLIANNFHIIVQHTLKESCSEDGLIVARLNSIKGINSIKVSKLK